ncbi:hypothetical protein [Bacillus sp. 1P02SD]|uniref:hypothetical protein n=1 Tax=Bacillus sp. 1P02SD TaxID=3132264 RepID=UPI0039A3C191
MKGYGLSFNLRKVKENNAQLWDDYKEHFDNAKFEDEEEVYFHELPDGKAALEFLRKLLPEVLEKEIEKDFKKHRVKSAMEFTIPSFFCFMGCSLLRYSTN